MKSVIMDEIIEEVTEGIYKDYPLLLEKYGEKGRQKCREDNVHHIKHLQTAASMGDEKFFIDYAHWLNGILTSRGMKTEHLIDNFVRLQKAFRNKSRGSDFEEFIEVLDSTINSLMSSKKDK